MTNLHVRSGVIGAMSVSTSYALRPRTFPRFESAQRLTNVSDQRFVIVCRLDFKFSKSVYKEESVQSII